VLKLKKKIQQERTITICEEKDRNSRKIIETILLRKKKDDIDLNFFFYNSDHE